MRRSPGWRIVVSETQLFVDLCLSMVEYNRTRSDEARHALRVAQLAAEGRFGVTAGETDIGLAASLALCVEEGVMAVHGIVTPGDLESVMLHRLTVSHPDVIATARSAVRAAIGGVL